MSGGDQLSAGETSFASAFARCASEPIHVPGAIQPQGALLAALADGLIVTHASENLAQILGRSAEAVLGRPLEEAIGAVRPGRAWTLLGPEWNTLHLLAHRQARHLCIDILPAHAASPHERALVALTSALEAFKHVSGRQELCELAVRGLRDVTGYDRVIAYRFDREGHGEVIAEALADNMESYLGLRFPATDVPPQARRLYVR